MNTLSTNILIADDDSDDIEFLIEAINTVLPSANISAVKDGVAALRHIKTLPAPDVIFLDLNMPLKNGLDVLKDIYNHELLSNTPIVIYSTSNKLKDIDEAYNHDAAFYIVKPSSFRELCRIIQFLVSFLSAEERKRVCKTDFVLSEAKLDSSSFHISG